MGKETQIVQAGAGPGLAQQRESLAVALGAALAHHGRTHAYEELVALLGCGAAVSAAASEPVAAWEQLARDQQLPATAALLGLRIRELHPPQTSVGLRNSAEFAAHFRDSYVPLIRDALCAGQLVLAWRGWPAPAGERWGLITQVERGALRGCVPREDDSPEAPGGGEAESAPRALVGPAHQVYVVECAEPRRAPLVAEALLQTALGHSLAVWRGDRAPRGVVCGAAAWTLLAARLSEAGAADVLATLMAARRALRAWLEMTAVRCSPEAAAAARAWQDEESGIVTALSTCGDPADPVAFEAALRARVADVRGRAVLAEQIIRIARAEEQLYARLRPLSAGSVVAESSQ